MSNANGPARPLCALPSALFAVEAPAQVPMLSAGASVPTREQSIGRQTPPAYLCACAKAAHAQIDTVDKCRFAVIHRLLPLS